MKIYSFPYISTPDATVLILGIMPGQKSLELQQYYGHGGNAFWKIIFMIYGEAYSKDYELRKQILIKNKVALWDVLKGCEREGSADHAIEKEEVNDFDEFFERHPKISLIAFNGKNAEQYFIRFVNFRPKIPTIILSSTSSANGWMNFEQKLNDWKQIINASASN